MVIATIVASAACGSRTATPPAATTTRDAPQQWTRVELPTGAFDGGYPTNLNEHGQIVGVVGDPGQAVMWERGRLVQLPTPPGADKSSAEAINARGEIVGWASFVGGRSRTLLWRDGQLTDVGPGFPRGLTDGGAVFGEAGSWRGFVWERGQRVELPLEPRGMNADRVVVGVAAREIDATTPAGWPWDSEFRPVVWRDGETTVLETPRGFEELGSADAINERGEIAGLAMQPGGEHHLVVWRGGEASDLGVVAGGDVGGLLMNPLELDLNERGQVAVSTMLGFGGEAATFLGGEGQLRRLSAQILSIAIDDSGQIIGTSTRQDGSVAGVVWQDGRIAELPARGAGDVRPMAINERGEIVGTVMGRPVVWTPRPSR